MCVERKKANRKEGTYSLTAQIIGGAFADAGLFSRGIGWFMAEQNKHIGIVAHDPWLEPFEDAIRGRHDHALWQIGELTGHGQKTLSEFASGYL